LRLGNKPKTGAAIFNDGDDHTYLAMPRVWRGIEATPAPRT